MYQNEEKCSSHRSSIVYLQR